MRWRGDDDSYYGPSAVDSIEARARHRARYHPPAQQVGCAGYLASLLFFVGAALLYAGWAQPTFPSGTPIEREIAAFVLSNSLILGGIAVLLSVIMSFVARARRK